MPLRMHIPLPGPFSYSKTLKSSGESGIISKTLFWICIGWWVYAIYYMFVAVWLLTKYTGVGLWLGYVYLFKGGAYTVRKIREKRCEQKRDRPQRS